MCSYWCTVAILASAHMPLHLSLPLPPGHAGKNSLYLSSSSQGCSIPSCPFVFSGFGTYVATVAERVGACYVIPYVHTCLCVYIRTWVEPNDFVTLTDVTSAFA